MNWDSITLSILAGFGALLLILSQLREVLVKISDLISAWHEVRHSIRCTPDEERAPSAAAPPSDRV